MTAVSGHLTEAKFDNEYEGDWEYPPPEALFNAPVRTKVDQVGLLQFTVPPGAANMRAGEAGYCRQHQAACQRSQSALHMD